ncbi:MAG TPA: isoprenylcysteine carboxylmethyltransferase family protein, partial [Bryobacteraceae bacterium]|nr:isoprenylcysteine carboxylmethyltransferase family protein [Bryobacteraceae bacterium]
MTLETRAILKSVLLLAMLAAMLFVPAGTLRFWQAWVFLAVVAGATSFPLFYLMRRDPGLLARRMQTKEKSSEQRLFKILFVPLWVSAVSVPGLDRRLGWSRDLLGGVPLWLTVLAEAVVIGGYVLLFAVLKANTFAAATIRVEAGQKVISDGPYRCVRHPMYSAILLMVLATPLALGSYIAVPLTVLIVP